MATEKKQVNEELEETVQVEAVEENETVEETKETDELTSLKAELEKLSKELETTKNAYYKVYADMENTKRRLQQDFEVSNKYKLQSFGKDILPVIDNLERALIVNSDLEEVKNYAKGFDMIYRQLIDLLKKEGITEIEAMDKPFDPNFHQALLQEPKEGVESGVVIEVLQKGYMLKDRILRPAMVKVSE